MCINTYWRQHLCNYVVHCCISVSNINTTHAEKKAIELCEAINRQYSKDVFYINTVMLNILYNFIFLTIKDE